jgi:hypothetical protein
MNSIYYDYDKLGTENTTSGIVTSGTRTGFLVCTWFVQVYTGIYRYKPGTYQKHGSCTTGHDSRCAVSSFELIHKLAASSSLS